MINTERPDLVQHFHIGARALLDINLIRFAISLAYPISQWGEGGYFTRPNDFYLPSLCLEEGWGGVSAPCAMDSLFWNFKETKKNSIKAQIFIPKPMKEFSWLGSRAN